jgi:hypothetical protein
VTFERAPAIQTVFAVRRARRLEAEIESRPVLIGVPITHLSLAAEATTRNGCLAVSVGGTATPNIPVPRVNDGATRGHESLRSRSTIML